jgi:hypothetical protein
MKPARFDAHVFQEPFQKREFPSRIVITFQVMALTGVSPRDPDPIRPPSKSGEDEFGTHPGGTGYPDDSEVGRVLETAYTGQVCCTVTAPVAEKGGYFRLPVSHDHSQKESSTVLKISS